MDNILWGELFSYLKQQENCQVRGEGWLVPDLHKYLERANHLINAHDPEDRKNSRVCWSYKRCLRRVYDSHKEGNTFPIGTKKESFFSIY